MTTKLLDTAKIIKGYSFYVLQINRNHLG